MGTKFSNRGDAKMIQTRDGSTVGGFLRESHYWPYTLQLMTEIFPQQEIAIWGGIPRNAVLQSKGLKFPKNGDIDFLVYGENRDVEERTKHLAGISKNRWGMIKWNPEPGIVIDISTHQNQHLARKCNPSSLETSLRSCDLTTSALAYNPRTLILFDNGAFDAIEKEEVDVLYAEGESAPILMTRAVMHSQDLGFRLGERTVAMIKESYDPSLDRKIAEYLDYKEKIQELDKVLKGLKERAIK